MTNQFLFPHPFSVRGFSDFWEEGGRHAYSGELKGPAKAVY